MHINKKGIMTYKKIIAVVFAILGIVLYASVSNARSLYSTKADANVDYVTIGTPNELLTIEQRFTVSTLNVNHIAFKTRQVTHNDNAIEWTVFDGENVVSSGKTTRSNLENLIINVNTVSFDTQKTYRIVLSGTIGDVFMKTASGENSKGISVNNQQENSALIAKLVYGGFHTETFIVLIGLILYIVVFMGAITRLFNR